MHHETERFLWQSHGRSGVYEGEPELDMHGNIIGFIDTWGSECWRILRWIRRDRVDGEPRLMAVCERRSVT